MKALSLRDALGECCLTHDVALPADRIAADFAVRFAGVPATSHTRPEPAVRYTATGHAIPVLLGMYGDEERVRNWLPGLPERSTVDSVAKLLDQRAEPEHVTKAQCQQQVSSLAALPVLRATPRDAGPFLTMGLVHAGEALSVHRMLVLDDSRLAIWMVPGRQLLALYEKNKKLPVSINIGAPPAALVASALSSAILGGVSKLEIAGALAGAPIAVAEGVTQPVRVLADSEIVLEGYLDGSTADEPPPVSLPEFLGYDGDARAGLPVITVTAVTTRHNPVYQAVIGPGREQSVILGLAGALSVALSGTDDDWRLIDDLHFSASGGGMLTLNVAIRKKSARDDERLTDVARRIFAQHRFVKLIVFTDPDVDLRNPEDLWWAVTTRANLGTDCHAFGDFRPLPMDPSQAPDWRGGHGGTTRTFVDATTPFALNTQRSFG
ncbi:UbiD family decarboxylase [Lentzea alba]|uniref:UbiD family decarboxylase domain-containing protein n=1 Tax=Lentzea alba TaxID=2714351 RepID=UPI0039BF48F3